jgi:hypothetical protein
VKGKNPGGIAGGPHLSFAGWALFRRATAIWPELAAQGGHACGKVRPDENVMAGFIPAIRVLLHVGS